ncbi:MAG: methylenetetrahydrofolate reductase [NAD(P)H] [Gammaproteobacteria bacterium]|nr:methylenetetrahydrofolate reductase [NAD(P)H] [Gammaproteobacteria bacterium]
MKRSDIAHLSFEFFPPKSVRGTHNLLRTARRLAEYEPDFYSVTHGAGGSVRDGTLETIRILRAEGFNAIPHITWRDDTRETMVSLLETYEALSVDQLVVLRGDIADQDDVKPTTFHYARELVELIRTCTGQKFRLNVACYPEVHPEAQSPQDDIRHLKDKVDAGADCCITQYFYDAETYKEFVATCTKAGITQPIVPGIMPISNFPKLLAFSSKCGAKIPDWLRIKLTFMQGYQAKIREFGADVVADLCRTLLQNKASGLHFYTLNLARPTQAILTRLIDE